MTQLKEEGKHLLLYTIDRDVKLQVDDLLSALRPGFEYEPRYQSGASDGKTRYYEMQKYKNGFLFMISNGFKHKLLKEIKFDEVDLLPDLEVNDRMEFLKRVIGTLPFTPYKHQLQAFMNLTGNRQNLSIVATGGGKSLIAYLTLRYFWENKIKSILVVPTIGLTSQMFQDFKDYNAPQELIDDIKLIGGDNKDKKLDKPLVISTWQSLQNIIKEISVFDAILVDEAHQAKADILQEILKQPCPIKLGMTGSMPIIKVDSMALEQALGFPTRVINAKQLMELNLLTDTTVVSLFLNHPRDTTRSNMKYQDEVKFIRESPLRIQFVKNLVDKLTGVTVALYNTTEHGEATFLSLTGIKLTTKLKSDFEMMKKYNVFFMSGSTKPKVREQIRLFLNTQEGGESTVIGQMSVLSTGINIPRLKNLIFLSSTKSYTLVLQAMGRVMRLHEEKGDNVYVYDLVDCFTYKRETYSLKHFWQRHTYYTDEGHPIVEKEIDLANMRLKIDLI